jgi:hypothetical protein
MKTAAIGLSCLFLLTFSSGVSAQEEADKAAGPSASDLFRRFDEINARIATLEKELEKATDDGATDAALQETTNELAALKASLEEMKTRVAELEGAMTAPAPKEGEYVFDIGLSGYLRTTYTQVNDTEDQTSFVGLNDGFGQANARFIVDGQYDTTSFRLSFDGAVDERRSENTAAGSVKTELRDAYFTWAPCESFRIHTGQLKPPFDLEENKSTQNLMFASRSVESRGIHGVEGINVDGLSVDRQVGVTLDNNGKARKGDGIGFGYALAITNGRGANSPLNDNDSPAYYFRLEVYWEDHVTFGFGEFYNETTTGYAPDHIDELREGLTMDLSIDYFGVFAEFAFVQVTSSFPDVSAETTRTARGYHGTLGYRSSYGFGYAVRYATFDPTSDFDSTDPTVGQALDVDEVTYITPSLTWDVPRLPLRLQASYTITQENEARALDNDKFELVGQLSF